MKQNEKRIIGVLIILILCVAGVYVFVHLRKPVIQVPPTYAPDESMMEMPVEMEKEENATSAGLSREGTVEELLLEELESDVAADVEGEVMLEDRDGLWDDVEEDSVL